MGGVQLPVVFVIVGAFDREDGALAKTLSDVSRDTDLSVEFTLHVKVARCV